MCIEVEVVDASLKYNLFLGRSWTYAMQAVVTTVFWVLLFPHKGRIMTIDQLSFSHPDPSLGVSMLPMIDNPQPVIVNVGVGLCPPLMGTFDYPPLTENVHYMLADLDQPQAEIFQISSFHMMYFNDPWNLTSPSTNMEGTKHHGMAMPLSMTEVTYLIIQQASPDLDPTPSQELDPILEPIWDQGSLADTNSLDLVFPSDEAIIEAMTSLDRPWDDIHHRSYFLLELR
jgi:hypothetical protein